MRWELDLPYEPWDRAGSRGLDTWYDPRGAGGEKQAPVADATDADPEGA